MFDNTTHREKERERGRERKTEEDETRSPAVPSPTPRWVLVANWCFSSLFLLFSLTQSLFPSLPLSFSLSLIHIQCPIGWRGASEDTLLPQSRNNFGILTFTFNLFLSLLFSLSLFHTLTLSLSYLQKAPICHRCEGNSSLFFSIPLLLRHFVMADGIIRIFYREAKMS